MNVYLKGMMVAALFATIGMLPQAVSANTGAGATILNVVTVNYKDAGGTTALKASAFATVTVDLLAAGVTLTAPGDAATASGTAVVYTYTVTSNANGTDIYPLTSNVDAKTNVGAPTIIFKQGGATITDLTLGASVVTANTATTVTVPSDSATDLVVNDIVVIGVDGVDYAIQAISGAGTAASHNTTSHATTAETSVVITLKANAAGSNTVPNFGALAAGTLVAERQTFTVEVTSTTTNPGDGDVTLTISVGGPAGAGNPPFKGDQTLTTVQGASLAISKEVSTDGGATFAATGNAAPGATLTYRITIVNNGAGNATSVVITDPMPAYTTYTAGTAKLDSTANPVSYAVAAAALTDANDAPGTDAYDFAITTGNTATYNAGIIAAAARVVLFYQVTVQ